MSALVSSSRLSGYGGSDAVGVGDAAECSEKEQCRWQEAPLADTRCTGSEELR